MHTSGTARGWRISPSVIEAERRRSRAAFVTLIPDSSPLGREFYPKHLEFFAAGASFKERLFMPANRVGKAVAGAFEATCHLRAATRTGGRGEGLKYATDGWACGTNSQTTLHVVQGVPWAGQPRTWRRRLSPRPAPTP